MAIKMEISNTQLVDAVMKYSKRFDMLLCITPEIACTDENRKECISLIEKSCREGVDFVAPRYGLDYEAQHRDRGIYID